MISIFQQVFFSGKFCTISITRAKDCQSYLNKAPKLSYQALYSGNNRKSVRLALAIIHETTIAAARSYFLLRSDLSGFLTLINICWPISNLKQRYNPKVLENVIIFLQTFTDFYKIFPDWIDHWCASPSFKLTCQTKLALVTTLQAQADLTDELIDNEYEFVRTARFQSDPIESHFSQYQQMSGGRFLVSLRKF